MQNGDDFHDRFAAALGLPDDYGRSMSAWADALRTADASGSPIALAPGALLTLRLAGMTDLRLARPDIHDALLEAAALVNHRRLDAGNPAIVALAYA